METKNEDGIQNDVADGADGHGAHTCHGEALRVDERVQSQGNLDENRADGINFHIIPCVADGVFTGSEHEEQRLAEDQDDGGQDQCHENQHGGAVSQNFFRIVLLSLSHHDGGSRRAAHAHQSRESGNRHDERHGNAHAGEGVGTDVLNMPDVHTVHHIVHDIDDLGHNGRKGQLKKKAADGTVPQIGLLCLCLFHGIASFLSISFVQKRTISSYPSYKGKDEMSIDISPFLYESPYFCNQRLASSSMISSQVMSFSAISTII